MGWCEPPTMMGKLDGLVNLSPTVNCREQQKTSRHSRALWLPERPRITAAPRVQARWCAFLGSVTVGRPLRRRHRTITRHCLQFSPGSAAGVTLTSDVRQMTAGSHVHAGGGSAAGQGTNQLIPRMIDQQHCARPPSDHSGEPETILCSSVLRGISFETC